MAKINITHSCGHTQEHSLFGPGKDRDSKAEWLSGRPCTECWKIDERAKRDAEGPKWSVNILPAYDPKRASESHAAKAIRAQIRLDALEDAQKSGLSSVQDMERATREVRDQQYAAKRALERPAFAGAVEFVCVNSFAVKDQLKARGYRYNADAVSNDLLGMRTTPGWTKQFNAEQAIAAEVQWIVENGWKAPEVPNIVKRLFDVVALGRPDLLPVDQEDTVAAATADREAAKIARAEQCARREADLRDQAERNAKAATFTIGDKPGTVSLKVQHGDSVYDFAVGSKDGRVAYGWNTDDWFVVTIVRQDGSSVNLPPGSAESDRIGRQARDFYKATIK